MAEKESEDAGGGGDSKPLAFDSLLEIFGMDKDSLKNSGTKGMLKLLVSSLYTYNNRPHRSEVRKFIKHLKNPKFENVQQALFSIVLESLSPREQYVSTQATSKTALELLKWITKICNGSNNLPQNFPQLLAVLLSRVQGKRLERSAEKKLDMFYNSLDKNTFEKLLKDLVKLEGSIVAISVTIKYLHRTNRLKEYLGVGDLPTKAGVLDLFVKECLTTKVAKSSWALDKTTKNLLTTMLTEEDFKTTLLPVIQKAMLRSPEIAIESVGFILENIRFDLSPFAMDLGKILGGSLHSQEEVTRQQAVFSSKALVKNVRSIEAAKAVIGWYFDIFNGAEGKISVAAHKINILTTIKLMRECGVPNSQLDQLSKYVIQRSTKTLESEVHEGTVLEILDLITYWTEKLSGEIPSELTAYLKKSLPNLKGAVRTSVGNVIVSMFSDSRTVHIESMFDILCKNYEKSAATITQMNGLSECIAFATVILRGNVSVPDSLISSFWLLWPHINEKFISSCNHWSVLHIAYLVDKMFPRAKDRVNEKVFDALALSVVMKGYQTRQRVQKNVFATLRSANDVGYYAELIRGLRKAFETSNISDHLKDEVLKKLSLEVLELKEHDKESLAMELIWPAHLAKNDSWVKIVQSMKLDPGRLLSHRSTEVNEKFIQQFDGSETMRSILSTVAFVVGEKVVKSSVERFKSIVSDPELLNVSRDDYFIFRTPEGQLYDNSVIEAAEDSTKNLKRESRVYSYKEQLEEIQLRKELEEKRKKSGKPVVYTHKQKEAIKNQLTKEATIRDNVAKLHARVNIGMGLLESTFEGNSGIFGMFLKDLINKLIEIMRSPVAAPDAVKFFVKLGTSLFEPEIRGRAVAHRSLRLIAPNCDLPKEWEEDKLLAALQNTIEYIRKVSQGEDGLNGAAFSYCFPMFRSAVRQFPKDSRVIQGVLNIIVVVAKDASGSLKTRDSFIPRSELVELLYCLIGTNEGIVQQMAFSALLAMTKLIESTVNLLEEKEMYSHAEALTSHLKICREAGLKCLLIVCPLWDTTDKILEYSIVASVYREQFDSVSDLALIAEDIWKKSKYSVDEGLYGELFRAVLHPCEEVRGSASKALGAFLKIHSSKMDQAIQDLIAAYHEYEIPTPALLDNFGRVIQEGIDKWEGRCGVGLAMREMASEMLPSTAKVCMEWLISSTLSDRSQAVHQIMLEASVEIVQIHGTECLNEFIATIETFLDKVGSSAKYDNVRQACVVLMGCLARHLDPNDSRVKSIFGTLIDTLSTPSEKVQEAVANCLPALVPAVSSESATILKRLLEKLMEAENFGERRGAAFGIAGMIKGLGILSLKQHDIMNILATGMQNKKNYRHREGSLMALELLCEFLGRLFEPYIVHVLPYLLQCLGDSNVYVREATENTAKRVMSRLSGHGVKLVLPALIGALNEDSWRTKCGSVDLLGRMAYCAPKQLSGCLPMIVPRLIEVLGDSHVKVQESGAKALGLIGSVIQNPEIQSVVPVLLQALQDPGKKATSCLQSLLQTEFVHFVDPPSLALIMPVVQRAFQDRSTENRKMACQVIGNMYSLTDHSDLAPYMENVMPGIKASLVDPVPEVRAVAAKALGAMAKGMGEKCYDELLPWLMKTLVSEANSVDRSGAAQGLAEVIGSLGEDKLHRFMPEIIRKADSDDLAPHVRDGYMMMFIYMPGVFETEFVPYIGQIINPILKALADENEFVRDTALRAGQRIVTGFAETAITLLLPELEKGIFDDNWRIRFSSVQLLGDLLYKISGVSGKMSTESAGDDDNFGTEQSQQTIISALGSERRNRVLSGLYMGRSDVALMVRQAALHVWKVVVANTPKTLREILPTLFSLLLGCLASHSHDKRQVAARTLGDLVRKLGEKILPEIIPILEKGLESNRADEREGVCIGLSEIMASTSRDMVLAFVDNLVPTLRRVLCDPNPKVREAAAQTFGSLHSTVGSRALDEIVPFLMRKLGDSTEGEYALDGLGQILVVKSKAVMPYLIPQLTAHPVNTKALAILASVAGDSLSRHLGKILPALLSVLTETAGTPRQQEELQYCERIVLTVLDEQGVRLMIDDLFDHTKTDNEGTKKAAITLLSLFCIHTKADVEPYISQLIRGLIQLMTETDDQILILLADGLAAVVKTLDSAEKLTYVGDVRQAIRFVKSDLKGKPTLPGLCTSKGINPVLPIFREALLNGRADIKEQAALGMGEVIALSTEVALKPSVIHITGPLIRILGDRYGPEVKVAVLDTLTLLLIKVGVHLKPFFPQLQTTFSKASNDPDRIVKLKAATALTQLTQLMPTPNR